MTLYMVTLNSSEVVVEPFFYYPHPTVRNLSNPHFVAVVKSGSIFSIVRGGSTKFLHVPDPSAAS